VYFYSSLQLSFKKLFQKAVPTQDTSQQHTTERYPFRETKNFEKFLEEVSLAVDCFLNDKSANAG
jgi:hypothetical protein